MKRRRRKSEAVPPANQGVGARPEARGGCGGLTGGDATEASRVNHSRGRARAGQAEARAAAALLANNPRCHLGPRRKQLAGDFNCRVLYGGFILRRL